MATQELGNSSVFKKNHCGFGHLVMTGQKERATAGLLVTTTPAIPCRDQTLARHPGTSFLNGMQACYPSHVKPLGQHQGLLVLEADHADEASGQWMRHGVALVLVGSNGRQSPCFATMRQAWPPVADELPSASLQAHNLPGDYPGGLFLRVLRRKHDLEGRRHLGQARKPVHTSAATAHLVRPRRQ